MVTGDNSGSCLLYLHYS